MRRHPPLPIIVTAAGAVAALLAVVVVSAQASSGADAAPGAADIPPAYLAAYQRAAAEVSPPIPWQILAGIGRVATDQGRTTPAVGASIVSASTASAPAAAPPSTPPAPPPTPGSPPPGGPTSALVTDPANLPLYLAGERRVESGGDYRAGNGGASGAYQFMASTWSTDARAAGQGAWASGPAGAAPPAVQDAVAGWAAQQFFASLHSWYWVAEAWYQPAWAAKPSEQNAVPAAGAGNSLTMAQYATKVVAAMAAAPAPTAAPSVSAPSVPAPDGPIPVSPPLPTAAGAGPLLLTPAAAPPTGASLTDIQTAADILAVDAAPVEERTWRQLGLSGDVASAPLADPAAQRFWAAVLPQLPIAVSAAGDELSEAEYYAGLIPEPPLTTGAPTNGADPVTVPAPTAPGSAPAAATALQFALAQLGKPYVYGAVGPDAFDCSGLVMAAYRAAGISLPRTTYTQVAAGQPVPLQAAALAPGDLLFIMGSDPEGGLPGHVGMYLGNGQVIEAPHTGTVVKITPLSTWLPDLVAARRVTGP